MNLDNLVKMANQIGTFFAAMPDRDEALADIATHLRRFWAPPMRRALLEGGGQRSRGCGRADRAGGAGAPSGGVIGSGPAHPDRMDVSGRPAVRYAALALRGATSARMVSPTRCSTVFKS
ncbi:hypothetical protein OJJOAM_002646 [Cupriavidus sp. H18C1]